MTFGSKCNAIKDEIKHALNNEVIDHYDNEDRPVYIKAEKTETRKVILDKFDYVVYEALEAMASGRALERLYKEKTKKDPNLKDYIEIMEEETHKYCDYRYENEEMNSGQVVTFPKKEN